ncbi:hypothetical protein TSTA_095800 [Talaromyces stipitatus ATCC 10500]|uniref:Uncharacterized protein n=1 Tax=Talaromyces stipitatus (strain ATCC 10500 / CBS 375.48 / QM 6759 / NRRL 1006) TaxID=441959 RepID=B8M3F9_TALSN|nr:uncharacterized protein TSTA_095800 [Talaromyces stipitatus ATCC 10500]EED22331.1 hypothetical protein TSTA_095800 [Talaromyces stipitatus ATCC 10500]
MTRPKHQPLLTSQATQSSLTIATNLLLRCEHFFRSLAFLEKSTSDPKSLLQQIQSLCSDFHETLFIIDQTLYKHRMEHGRAKHRKGEEEDDDDEGYRVLSEINEQLTDYAFLVGKKIHPWDVPYVFLESTTTAKVLVERPAEFPPATWRNRELRGTTTPLAGFPLEGLGADCVNGLEMYHRLDLGDMWAN